MSSVRPDAAFDESDDDFDDLPLSSLPKPALSPSSSRKRRRAINDDDDDDDDGDFAGNNMHGSAVSSPRKSAGSPAKRSRRLDTHPAPKHEDVLMNVANGDAHSSKASRLAKSRRRAKQSANAARRPKEEPTVAENGATSTVKASRRAKSEQEIVENGTGRQAGTGDPNETNSQGRKWWEADNDGQSGIKWTTLMHHGVLFPPSYEPHGVPMLYDGETIELDPVSEEVATFYAQKLQTDYVQKEIFNTNFFECFLAVLKKNNPAAYRKISVLEKCDFTKIYDLLEERKNEKKALPAAEKKRLREEEKERNAKYTVALVDGREEKVGNYRVEPPGLFLGRGEHPKMGQVKKRIMPEDITINIGEDAPIPECPPGHKWGSIVHKRDVTWLAGWKDSITNGHKYVWLSAGSAFKGMSDHAKFEKSRKLKLYIENVRRDYREGWTAKSKEIRQRSVAMYLIDKLALRVGNEKGEDEADTVGCCSLRVEHIKFLGNNVIEFDFLGKDSIRYLNEVTVEAQVYRNMKLFCDSKQPKDSIFHRLSVTSLNDYLKNIMPGLSAKVFRTYNASITLSGLLRNTPEDANLNDKIVFYNQQNKEVAILCNHQRALPKAHGSQMEKLQKKEKDIEQWIAELKRGRRELRKKNAPEKVEIIQLVPVKAELTPDMTDEQRAQERKRVAELPKEEKPLMRSLEQIEKALKQAKDRLAKLRADMTVKEELKTVALGTSKINYLDPRITVAWCKKYDVPIERIFAKTLLTKFAWAMETSQNFEF